MIEVIIELLCIWIIAHIIYKAFLRKRLRSVSIGVCYLIFKSIHLNNWLALWAERHRKILNSLFDIGSVIGFITLVYAYYILVRNIIQHITCGKGGYVQILIPGITISIDTFMKMLPAIIILIFSHEIAHKIALHSNSIKIKSMGFFILFIIPGAYVEPDYNELLKASTRSKLRILAAGTFVNLLIGAIFAPLVIYPCVYNVAISPLYDAPSGVLIVRVINGTPLYNASIHGLIHKGDVIIQINNSLIKSVDDLRKIHLKPGDIVIIKYLNREKNLIQTLYLRTMKDPYNGSRGIIGFIPADYYPPKFSFLDPMWPLYIKEILFWIFFLGINIAIFNMLPIYMLDGYHYVNALLNSINIDEQLRRIILNTLMGLSLSLLFVNIFLACV